MSWDATATRNGEVVYNWKTKTVVDADLAAAFQQANEELIAETGISGFLRMGYIAYSEAREPLETATGRKCVSNSPDGRMYWCAHVVQDINKTINWNFAYGGPKELYNSAGQHDPNGKYDVDGRYDFDLCAKLEAQLFWQVCVTHNLGISFTW